jgi:signal transduction histidine kinase
MAVVLAGLAVFLYARLGDELQRNIDLELRARAGVITAALTARHAAPVNAARSVIDPDESFAQVLDRSSGAVVDTSRAVRSAPMFDRAELRDVAGPTFVSKQVVGVADPSRLLAVPVRAQGHEFVVVVGTNLGDKNEALDRLFLLLAVGIPAALLLASGIGWVVAGAALRPLDAALDAERRFIDEASHDLRTPLGVLKAELDLALRRPRTTEELEQTLHTAAEQTDHLVQLAEDLLVHARTRRGPIPVRREPVELASFCADAAASFRTLGRSVRVESDERVVHVDPVLMRQAVRNLLDNAFAHGGGAEVTLRATCIGDRVAVSVGDAGPGLPPELHGRLARADGGGEGLGLSIVASVAEAHGGFATADRSPSGGARVTIDVPDQELSGYSNRTASGLPRPASQGTGSA